MFLREEKNPRSGRRKRTYRKPIDGGSQEEKLFLDVRKRRPFMPAPSFQELQHEPHSKTHQRVLRPEIPHVVPVEVLVVPAHLREEDHGHGEGEGEEPDQGQEDGVRPGPGRGKRKEKR